MRSLTEGQEVGKVDVYGWGGGGGGERGRGGDGGGGGGRGRGQGWGSREDCLPQAEIYTI